MDHIFGFNVLMAASIAGIIVVISAIQNPFLKAIVYGFPIPISLALIATQKPVDGSHIIGLFLLTGFLWMVYYLKEKFSLSILLANVISVVIYVVSGFILIVLLPVQEYSIELAFLYAFLWLLFVSFVYKRGDASSLPKEKMRPLTKGAITFAISFILLSGKKILEGIVVTFPFSGIFAVVEMQDDLEILATEFTKNSVAILIFLVVIEAIGPYMGIVPSILIGWIVYAGVLLLVRRLIK